MAQLPDYPDIWLEGTFYTESVSSTNWRRVYHTHESAVRKAEQIHDDFCIVLSGKHQTINYIDWKQYYFVHIASGFVFAPTHKHGIKFLLELWRDSNFTVYRQSGTFVASGNLTITITSKRRFKVLRNVSED